MSSSTSTNLNGMNSAFTFHIPRVSLSARHRYDPVPQERRTTPTFAYDSASSLPVSSSGNPITSGGDGPFLSSGTSYNVSQASADVATYDNDAVQFHIPKDTRSTVADLYDLPKSPTSTQPVNEKFLECVLGVLESIKSPSPPEDDAPSLPVDDFIPQESSYDDVPDKENIDPEPSSVTSSKGKEVLGSPLTNALSDTINWDALLNLEDDPVTKLFVDYIIENRKTFTFEGVSAFLDICAQDGLTIDEVTRSNIFKMIGHSPRIDTSLLYAQDSSFHGEEAYSSMGENSGAASQTRRLPDIVTQGAGASTYPGVVGAYPDNQPAWPSSFQSLNHHSQNLCNTYGAYGAPTSYDPRYVAAPNSMGTPYQNGAVSSYHEPTAYGWNNFTGYSHFAGPSVGQSQPTWNVYVPPTPSLASSSSSSSGSRASSVLPTPIEGNFEFNVGHKRSHSDAGLDEYSQFGINGGFSQPSMNITPIGDNASQVTWHVNSFQYEGQPAAQSAQARPAKKRKSPKQGGQAPPTGTQKARKRTKVRDLLSYQVYDPILWIARDMPACGSEIFCPQLDCQTFIRLDENEDKHITIFRHVLKHSELTTIQCPCGRHFCRPDSLKRHAKKSKHSECMYWLNFIRWQEGRFRRKVKKVCKLYKEGKENQALALKEEIIVFRLACQRHNRRLAGKLQVVKGDSLALSDWKLLSAGFEEDGASAVFGREISRCAMLYTM